MIQMHAIRMPDSRPYNNSPTGPANSTPATQSADGEAAMTPAAATMHTTSPMYSCRVLVSIVPNILLRAARFIRRCHQACSWPERLTIAGFLLGALCEALLLAR